MVIYIEIFILQNILINFCLLRLVYLTTKSKTSLFKLILSCIIGTIPSVLAVVILSNNLTINLIKIITATTMISIAFNQNKKEFVFNFILLYLYTFAFGGIILNLSSNSYLTNFGYVTTSKFSLKIICVIFAIFTYFFELSVKHLKLKFSTNSLIYNLTITHSNKTIKLNAYMDTGNFLNHNNQPVLILDLNTYLELTNTNLLSFITKKTEQISTSTVNGENNLKLFRVDEIKFKINKKEIKLNNQYVAINSSNCFKNTNYKALLSPLFL